MPSISALLSVGLCLAHVSHSRRLSFFLIGPLFLFRASPVVTDTKLHVEAIVLTPLFFAVLAAMCSSWTRPRALPPSSCLSSTSERVTALMSTDTVADSRRLQDGHRRERKIQGGGVCGAGQGGRDVT